LLGVVEDPELEPASSTFLGTVPEVDAIGEEGVMLGLEDDDDEGSVALANVLAFGILIFTAGLAVGSLAAEVPGGRGMFGQE
jgi:hypothetical protein